MNAKLYFIDIDKAEYRVYDITIANGKRRRLLLADPAATHRVFVSDGKLPDRLYSFRRYEPHGINEVELERQFREAEIAPSPERQRASHPE